MVTPPLLDLHIEVPLVRIADSVYAIDIDPAMLHRAMALAAAAGTTNCHFVLANAMTVDAVVPEPVDYVFLANTFPGVPDKLDLAQVVAAIFNPKGNSGSSIGIVVLARKRWSSGRLADRGRNADRSPRRRGKRETRGSLAEPNC
jgi:hypothetical protein